VAEDSALVENAPEPAGWLLACEEAVAGLERAGRYLGNAAEPTHDLKPGAESLSRGLAAIFSALDQRGDPLLETREAIGHLLTATQELTPAAADDAMVARACELVDSSCARLDEVEAHFARQAGAPDVDPRPLTASRHVPSLHEVSRASLAPKYRVPESLAPPPIALAPLPAATKASEMTEIREKVRARAVELRELRKGGKPEPEPAALVPPTPDGFAEPIPEPTSPYDFVRARLRDCFEEVAMLGSQRQPQLGDPWRTISFLDKRLLNNLDAVASLGAAAIHGIEDLVADSPVKDPSRGFAAAFLLGCIEGRDSLAAAERIIRHLGADDPEVWEYAVQALRLVPHPHLDLAMRTLLRDYDPAIRSLALEVLVRREMVSVAELATLVNDDAAAVVRVALPALAVGAPRHPDLSTRIVEAEATVGLERAAWLAMALSAHPRAASGPEHKLSDEELGDDAALALALVCDLTATARIRAACREQPRPALARALGWCGDAEHDVPFLIELLRNDDDELQDACARALDRICAAELYEEVEIDPEELIIPEPQTPDMGALDPPKLAQEVSDPRDEPSPGSPDTILRPTTDATRWTKWWSAQGRRFEAGARYRRGRGYTPQVSLWELDGWILTAPEREHLVRELVVRTGHWVALDPLDFIERQEAGLRRWSELVSTASQSPGSWVRPSRRT
jgi:hypothetical protein